MQHGGLMVEVTPWEAKLLEFVSGRPRGGLSDLGGQMQAAQIGQQLNRAGATGPFSQDTEMALVTPGEKQALKQMGGSGLPHPATGTPSFAPLATADLFPYDAIGGLADHSVKTGAGVDRFDNVKTGGGNIGRAINQPAMAPPGIPVGSAEDLRYKFRDAAPAQMFDAFRARWAVDPENPDQLPPGYTADSG